jgi:hypothetical protein
MSKPDWTEAPTEATHWDEIADVFCNVNGWWCQSRLTFWHKNQYVLAENKDWGTDRYTPRPVEPATTAWNGTGFPPVGTKCEGVWLEVPDGGDRDFEGVIIKGYYKKQVWFCTTNGEDITHLTENVDFRPIRTQAQIDREELEDLLTKANASGLTVKGLASCIIARGYRLER